MKNRCSIDDAASESIGTILMVAVTITIAAMVALTLFGMPHEVKDMNIVAASAVLDNDAITITYHGGPAHDQLEYLNWTITNSSGNQYSEGAGYVNGVSTPEVGFSFTTNQEMHSPPYRVAVAATFKNENTKLILDTDV